MFLILAIIAGFLSVMVPGFFLSYALLKKTELNLFEIVVIGFILGLIVPPVAIWLEAYLIPVSSAFAFSENLYNINIVVITLIGILLSFQQGALSMNMFKDPRSTIATTDIRKISSDYKGRLSELRQKLKSVSTSVKMVVEHQKQEEQLIESQNREVESLNSVGPEERARIKQMHADQERRLYEQHEVEERQFLNASSGKKDFNLNPIWAILFILMILTFATRIINIQQAPTYFEFDPYFDMLSTQYILTYGYQLQYSHEAWPTLTNGTVERLQPIVPYIEAYWFELAGGNSVVPANQTSFAAATNSNPPNATTLSAVSSWYPPIVAALLVFVVFMILYHLYGDFPAIIGAAFAAAMPTLLTTFIAGEQLLEPWGIFAMFFFVATYLMAVRNPKEKRYAILAGIAFASNFFGAHYYTVTTGILAVYIILQGLFNVIKSRNNRDFYIMNAIVIIVIAITYALYGPYEATLTERTSAVLGLPIVVAFPLVALIVVYVYEYILKMATEKKMLFNRTDETSNLYRSLAILAIFIILGLIIVFLTPLGAPVQSYVALSTKFTTPSSPLFMTVQEYAPTGANFDFGSGGFGFIGASIAGVNVVVWMVLIIFSALVVYQTLLKDSQNGIFLLATVVPLALAGMLEVKYLPHFGVGYIIAIGVIIGELMIILKDNMTARRAVTILVIAIVLVEALPSIGGAISGYGATCTSIVNSGNAVGDAMYCNTVPNYWLTAMSWAASNIGPAGPRILSWWDYGDWINWFGNSNAVLRGDNSVATSDYQAAAFFVLGSKNSYNGITFNSTSMASYMNGIQAKYVLFDDQLIPKWGALDFLGCVYIGQTSEAYAYSQGKVYNQPFTLGTSNCETTHDPAEIWIPENPSVNEFCQLANTSVSAVEAQVILGFGQSAVNQTYCAPESFLQGNTTALLYPNGTKTNIIITDQLFEGGITVSGTPLYTFIALYLPNAPNGSITNAPSEFYNSNYYQGYFFGKLPGYTLVYPTNFTGVNYINDVDKVMILAVNNYTGGDTPKTAKPSWIKNNFTIPG